MEFRHSDNVRVNASIILIKESFSFFKSGRFSFTAFLKLSKMLTLYFHLSFSTYQNNRYELSRLIAKTHSYDLITRKSSLSLLWSLFVSENPLFGMYIGLRSAAMNFCWLRALCISLLL